MLDLHSSSIGVHSLTLWNLESKPKYWREAVSGIAFCFYLGKHSQVITKIGKAEGNNPLISGRTATVK